MKDANLREKRPSSVEISSNTRHQQCLEYLEQYPMVSLTFWSLGFAFLLRLFQKKVDKADRIRQFDARTTTSQPDHRTN